MKKPIVGIGEVLWDIYPDGRKVAGGAPFNFVFHCHQLWHPAVILSSVKDDQLGKELRAEVRRLGLTDEFIQTDKTHATGTVDVTIDSLGQPSYTIASDVAWDHIEWTPALESLIQHAAAVCHGTLALRSPVSAATTRRAAEMQPTIGNIDRYTIYDINIRGAPPSLHAILAARWIKVNESEYGVFRTIIETAMGNGPWPHNEAGIFRYLHDLTGIENRAIIITRGAAGAEVITAERKHLVPAVPATVVDTVGAGDAFTAAMVCLRLEERDLFDCARFASHYAARVCEYQGATPIIDRAEIEHAVFGTP